MPHRALRRRAERYRQLALKVTSHRDRIMLVQLAAELDARAAAMEDPRAAAMEDMGEENTDRPDEPEKS